MEFCPYLLRFAHKHVTQIVDSRRACELVTGAQRKYNQQEQVGSFQRMRTQKIFWR